MEVTCLSHGFLTVQIEVSLLPLCVGRSHQAGGGSVRAAPATCAASSWAGSKVVQGQDPPTQGAEGRAPNSGDRRCLEAPWRASSRVDTATLAGRAGVELVP